MSDLRASDTLNPLQTPISANNKAGQGSSEPSTSKIHVIQQMDTESQARKEDAVMMETDTNRDRVTVMSSPSEGSLKRKASKHEMSRDSSLTLVSESIEKKSTSSKAVEHNGKENKAEEKIVKKAKLSKDDPSSTPKPSPSTTPLSDDLATAKQLIDLNAKTGKLSCKQKVFSWNAWDNAAPGLKVKIAWQEFLSQQKDPLEKFPEEHLTLLARLVHESDRTLPTLIKDIKAVLQPSTSTDEEDDEEGQTQGTAEKRELLPSSTLETVIHSIAERRNHGLEMGDVVAAKLIAGGSKEEESAGGNRSGMKLPNGFAVWRWEVKDREVLLPEEVRERLEKRYEERLKIKSSALTILKCLTVEQRTNLLVPSSEGSSKSKPSAIKNSTDTSAKGEESPGRKSEGSQSKVKSKKAKAVSALDGEGKSKQTVKAEVKAEEDEESEEAKKERLATEADKAARKAEREVKAAKRAEKDAKVEKTKEEVKKQSMAFTGFFKKPSISPVAKKCTSPAPGPSDFDKIFRPFHVKQGAELAPINRFHDSSKGKGVAVDVDSLSSLSKEDALKDFLKRVPPSRILRYDPHPSPPIRVSEIVKAINESDLAGGSFENVRRWHDTLKDRRKVQVKFLKFNTDERPGYYGTWTKSSRVIGPRTPLGKDTCLLNYEYDSEAEWEEDAGDGEDVQSSGGESETEDRMSEDDDGWLCGDDEVEMMDGFEGFAEGVVGGDDEAWMMRDLDDAHAKRAVEKRNRTIKDSEKRKKFTGPLVPISKGPLWESRLGEPGWSGLEQYKIQFLNDAPVGLNPFTFVSKPFIASRQTTASKPTKPANPSSNSDSTIVTELVANVPATVSAPSAAAASKPRPTAKPFPTSLMPRFIKCIQEAKATKKKLLSKELKEAFKDEKISLTTIVAQMDACTVKAPKSLGGHITVDNQTLNRYNGQSLD